MNRCDLHIKAVLLILRQCFKHYYYYNIILPARFSQSPMSSGFCNTIDKVEPRFKLQKTYSPLIHTKLVHRSGTYVAVIRTMSTCGSPDQDSR